MRRSFESGKNAYNDDKFCTTHGFKNKTGACLIKFSKPVTALVSSLADSRQTARLLFAETASSTHVDHGVTAIPASRRCAAAFSDAASKCAIAAHVSPFATVKTPV